MSDIITLTELPRSLKKIPIMLSQEQAALLVETQVLCEAISYNETVRRASILLRRHIEDSNNQPGLYTTSQRMNIRVNLNLDNKTIERLDDLVHVYGNRSNIIRVALKLFRDQYTADTYHRKETLND